MGFPDFGLGFGNPDFVALAQAFGATGVRIERTEALLPALKTALQTGGVHLLDVPIDYRENQLLTQELEESASD